MSVPSPATVLAALLAIAGCVALVELVRGYLEMPSLRDVPPVADAEAPFVSIVVAARDEERHIATAVRALLDLRYPHYELIVVDDRSSDATPTILAGLAARDPRLQVVRIDQLPAGWLGKNHALHVGAGRARGALLLFTDADVILDGDALARAVRLLRLEHADHLAVGPELDNPTWPLALVVNYFLMWFLLWLKPWKARDPRSRRFIGIGAFNLVRAGAYREVQGHARLALRPDDDIMLGKLLKGAGFRQLIADGAGAVRVEWYASLPDMARGLRKNTFAGLRYSVLFTLAALSTTLLLGVWPFVGVWMADGATRWLLGAAALTQLLAYAGPTVVSRSRPWLTLLYPVAAVLFAWIVGSAVARTLARGGIDWRDTFYPLDALRRNRV